MCSFIGLSLVWWFLIVEILCVELFMYVSSCLPYCILSEFFVPVSNLNPPHPQKNSS